MDSPLLQSSNPLQRMRTSSNLSVHSINNRGAIRKQSLSRSRSISTSQLERLHQLAVEQSNHPNSTAPPPTSIAPQWITPQHSPQPQVFSEPSVEPFPQWTVPTPPRSDSGLPTVSVDSNEVPVTTGISSSQDFNFDQPTASAEMRSVRFVVQRYDSSANDKAARWASCCLRNTDLAFSNLNLAVRKKPTPTFPNPHLMFAGYTMDQNYAPSMRMSQPAATSGSSAYAPTISSSPALYQSRTMPASTSSSRRHSELPNSGVSDPSYNQSYRRISNPYDTMSGGDYSMAPSQTIPSITGLTQSPLPSPHMGAGSGGSMMPHYNTGMSRYFLAESFRCRNINT